MTIKAFENLAEKLQEIGLEEDKINEIVEYEKKNVPKDFIPSSKHKELLSEQEAKLNEINTKFAETNKKLESLKDNNNSEELQEQLNKIKNEYEDFKNNVEKRETIRKKQNIFKNHLLEKGFNTKGVELLANQVNFDDMQLKDDKIIGIDEHTESLEEEYGFLKVNTQAQSKEPEKGESNTTVDTSKMTDQEYYNWKLSQKK